MRNTILMVVASVLFSSCIKEEAPNAEADIECCVIKNPRILVQESDTLYKVGTENNSILLRVRANCDLSMLAPEFILSEGATIDPPSGTALDFSNGIVRKYTVTSEDGNWQKTYDLCFKVPFVSTHFGFEHAELDAEFSKYYCFYEMAANGEKERIWATGNPGFMLAKSQITPDEYPSVLYEKGRTGSCVKLETKDIGSFGAMMGMRLAAGNIFIGSFDVLNASFKPLEATHFGIPFNKKPITLKGWYKYEAGKSFEDAKGEVVAGKVDEPDVYAVLYENTSENGEAVVLDGSNIQTSEHVVAIARAKSLSGAVDWTEFDLPFDYLKPINQERLDAFGYNMTVVFSSSLNGALFIGAIGSSFYIDDVDLVCEE